MAAVLAALPDEGTIEVVWEDRDGRITSRIADEEEFAAVTTEVAGARGAALLSMYVDERVPLFTAVLPDDDGVLRARWRTEPTPSDRDWAFLRTLRRGQVVTGTVAGIADFGVTFVDIGGFTAMVDVSQLAWRPVDHPGDVVAVGDRITAEVLDVDLVRERVPLSLRALQEDPITQFTRWVGRVVTGEVTRLVPAGALLRIEDRPDGFVGLLPAAGRAPSPSVRIGDRFPVSVVAVDPARRRITLSRAEPDGAEADGGT